MLESRRPLADRSGILPASPAHADVDFMADVPATSRLPLEPLRVQASCSAAVAISDSPDCVSVAL